MTKSAKEKIIKGEYSNLRIEHIVTKQKDRQYIWERKAKEGILSQEFIYNILNKYWYIATITKEEDDRLISKKMPSNWCGEDIFARYNSAGIFLEDNDL